MQEKRDTNSKPDNEAGIEGLSVIRPNVAGIDLGSKTHWVCAPNVDRTGVEVETLGATTPELERMAEWLKERNIESVAMESTGVYWIAPHEVLERHGLEVVLVNTRELARVLSGHWRKDHLFSLGQALKMYDAIQERIGEYEREILRQLAEMERAECRGQEPPKVNNPQKAKAIN